jgi:hypothetical protein
MKKILLLAVLIGAGLSQARAQQIYDAEGHLVAYQYPDGRRDLYTYDASWHLVKFESRDGALTQYRYAADGTMDVVSAPQK